MGNGLCGLTQPPYTAGTPSPPESPRVHTVETKPPTQRRLFPFTVRVFGKKENKYHVILAKKPPFPFDEIVLEPAHYWDDEGARIREIQGADYLIGSVILGINGKCVLITPFQDILKLLRDDSAAPFECVIQEGSKFEEWFPCWSLDDVLEHMEINSAFLQKEVWDHIEPVGDRRYDDPSGARISSRDNIEEKDRMHTLHNLHKPVYAMNQVREIFEYSVNHFRETYARVTDPINAQNEGNRLAPYCYLIEKEFHRWMRLYNPEYQELQNKRTQHEDYNLILELNDSPLFSVSDYFVFVKWLLDRIIQTHNDQRKRAATMSSLWSESGDIYNFSNLSVKELAKPKAEELPTYEDSCRLGHVHTYFHVYRPQLIAMLADCMPICTDSSGHSVTTQRTTEGEPGGATGHHTADTDAKDGSDMDMKDDGSELLLEQASPSLILKLFYKVDIYERNHIQGDAIAVFFFLAVREFAMNYCRILRERRRRIAGSTHNNNMGGTTSYSSMKMSKERGQQRVRQGDFINYGHIPVDGFIPPSWSQVRGYILRIYDDWKTATQRDLIYVSQLSQLSSQLFVSSERTYASVRSMGNPGITSTLLQSGESEHQSMFGAGSSHPSHHTTTNTVSGQKKRRRKRKKKER